MAENYAKRLAKGSTVVFSISILGAFLGYVLRIYLSRTLSVAEFGLFFAIMAFVGLFAMFYRLGLDEALVKHIPEFLHKKQADRIKSSFIFVMCIQLIAALIIFLPMFAFPGYFAENYFHNEAAAFPLVIVVFSSIAGIFMLINQKVFQGFGKMGFFSSVEPLRVVLTIGFLYVLAIMGIQNVTGVAYAYLLSAVSVSIITFLMVLRLFDFLKVKMNFTDETTKSLFAFAIPTFIGSMGSTILGYIDTIVLTYFRNLNEVGLYQIALPTSQLLSYFVSSLTIVLFPAVSEMWAGKKTELLSTTLRILIKFSFLFMIPVAMIFIAFPEIVIRLLFGEQYLHAARALQLLSAGSIFLSVAMIFMATLSGIGKPMLNTKTVFIVVTFNVLLNIALVPGFGATGAAAATAISYTLMMIIAAYYVRKSIKISMPVMPLLKIFLGGLITLALILYLKSLLEANAWVEAFICLPAGFIFYTFFILKTKAVSRADLSIIMKTGIPVPKKLADIASRLIKE